MDEVRRPEGCRLAHVAPMKITSGVLGYEAYQPIPGLEEIATTPIYAELKAFSDNQQDTARKKHIATEVSMTIRQLSPALEALLMGNKYVKGRKYSGQNDIQKPVALAYQETLSDGSYNNIVLYNVTLSREGRTNTGTTDAVEFDRVVLVGTGIPISTGEIEMVIDSLDPEAVPTDLTNFFTKVLLPGDEAPAANEAYNLSMHQMIEQYKNEMKSLRVQLEKEKASNNTENNKSTDLSLEKKK